MIFIDSLKAEYLDEITKFTHKIRNNTLFKNKFDDSFAKNYESIYKSFYKKLNLKNHFVIFKDDLFIGYLVLNFEERKLVVDEIYFDVINNDIVLKVLRFLVDYAQSNIFDIIIFKFKGFIFDEILKEHLKDNTLSISNDLFSSHSNEFVIINKNSSKSLVEFLKKAGYNVIFSLESKMIDEKIKEHVDMQIRMINDSSFICTKESYSHYRAFLPNGINLYMTELNCSSVYPRDCLVNNFSIKNYLVCNPKSVDPQILKILKNERIIRVNQGYSKCSTIVADDFLITSDNAILKKTKEKGVNSYLIEAGDIKLEGYDSGFIGGTCGYSKKLGIVFYGDISNYKYKQKLMEILDKENIKYYSPTDEEFVDYGSMIFYDIGGK